MSKIPVDDVKPTRYIQGRLACGPSDGGLHLILHPTHFDAIHALVADIEDMSVFM